MRNDSIDDIKKKESFKLKDWIETKDNIKKTFVHIKNNKKSLFLSILFSLLEIPVSIIAPILSAKLLLNLNNNDLYSLFKVALIMFIVYSVFAVVTFIAKIVYKKFSLKVTYDIQEEAINNIFNLSSETLDDKGTGVFIDRLRKDTGALVEVFQNITDAIIEILSGIGLFVVIFSYNKIIFAFYIIYLVITILLEKYRTKMFYQRTKVFKEMNEKNTGLVTEFIRGSRDIKVLNASKIFINKFDERINEANREDLQITLKDRRFYVFESIIDELFKLIFIGLGIFLIKKQLLTLSVFLVLYMYESKIANTFYYLGFLMDRLKSFNLSANRVYSLLDDSKFPKEHFGKETIKDFKGNIKFNNVCFGYKENKEIIHNVSLDIKEGKTYAFVGKSGSGKTTLVSLIDKLYDVNSGSIEIDGINVNNLTKNTIRNNITMITQSPYIFNLSIRENLQMVKENLTEEEMINACKTACIHDYIETLPNKYDSFVGEGGVTLSGGERQRLAIARALLKESKIILFDEATSALDNVTQAKIKEAIDNLKGDHTVIIIAHRLSTIIDSDKIFMIDKGNLVCSGTHNYLINHNKKYQELYKADLKKE